MSKFFEHPIDNLSFLPPDETGSGWSKALKNTYGWSRNQDIKLLSNPNALKKIRNIWKDTEHNYDIYFLRVRDRFKIRSGTTTEEELKSAYPEEFKNFVQKEDSITIIFTNNEGGDKVPMTGWMIAHRFGHALQRENDYLFKELSDYVINSLTRMLKEFYRVEVSRMPSYKTIIPPRGLMRKLCNAIGTTRSSREGRTANEYEFIYELICQYLLTKNKVVFNRNLPRVMHGAKSRKYYLVRQIDGEDITEVIDSDLSGFEELCNYYIDNLINSSVNKIFWF